jgi:hypothetical protein
MLLAAAFSAMLGGGCEQTRPEKQPGPASGLPSPPAAVTAVQPVLKGTLPTDREEKSLLLLEDGADASAADRVEADNSRCLVCHLNFAAEKLTVVHARASVSCEECHGVSDAHIADESWASGGNGTAPDIMFPKERINPFCLGCHVQERIEHKSHESFFGGIGAEKHCTDCHGKHYMAQRKCKWR